jgi:hypothetical protein
LRVRFFQVVGDYPDQAREYLEHAAQQFQRDPGRAARLESLRWKPDVSGRWERMFYEIGPLPDYAFDPVRPAVIARCLDQVAQATERVSAVAREINLRHAHSLALPAHLDVST